MLENLLGGDTGIFDFFDQNTREYSIRIAVPGAKTIECFLAGARRVQDHLSRGGRDRRQAAAADRAMIRVFKGIVAARIDDGERESGLLILEIVEHSLQWHRIVGHLLLALRHQIDGNQAIWAFELYAMPAKEEDHLIVAGNLALEGAQRFLLGLESQVALQRDRKTSLLERFRHGLGIGASVVQSINVLIGVVADYQGEASGV